MNNLRDKLSHLTYREACELLGPEGEQLIRAGGKYDIEISENLVLGRISSGFPWKRLL